MKGDFHFKQNEDLKVGEVGKTYVLTVTAGQQRQQFREIVPGEVWLCSGQSNMAFPLSQDADGRAMLEQSADSLLPFSHLAPRWETNDGAWSEAVPDSIDRGLYFATEGWQTDFLSCSMIRPTGILL